ncbi:methylenetetrahydrofolate reductase [Fervidobacterium pennivorans subsp. carthaginiensis]
MKITEMVKEKRIISIEIIPPKRGEDVENIYRTLDKLMRYDISFINITRHPVEVDYIEYEGRIIKVHKVKRPGTIGLTAALMNRYRIDVVPHLVCVGMSKFEMEDMLIDLDIMGVDNVFVIRGETTSGVGNYNKGDYKYAVDLVEQIKDLNMGKYLYTEAKPTNFCVGVAGYPEKHYESPNIETDLKFLKQKVDAGADYIITQMVFDADIYKNFVERCRSIGINVPIIPGVKPVVSKNSVFNIPKKFFVTIPQRFVEAIDNAKTKEEEFNVGIRFTVELVEKLIEYGAPGIHIFTMGRGEESCEVIKHTQSILK